MRLLMTSLCALGMWASMVLPVSAGWDNVFQPTLFGRQRTTTNYYYTPPVVVQSSPVVAQYSPVVVAQSAPCDTCAPAPQQQCSTSYVQRSYYQPVTTYENKTVMEQVTTYRTSYYYEPVTSYRMSCYVDPCTGCSKQVAVPQTSYQLRAQNCPVQSWVSRCVQVPVQGYQKVDYWQPQTTCCTTSQGAPIVSAPPVQQAPVQQQQQAPPVITPIPEQKPSISSYRTPGVESSKTPQWDQYYPPLQKTPEIRNSTPGMSLQPQLGTPVPLPQPPAPPVRLDRIAVGNSHVDGQVVRNDSSPKANAKLLFINAGTGARQTVFTNTAGRFQVDLPAGSWHVYVHGADDIPVHHSRIDVNGAQTRQVNLVSRSN